MRSLSLRTLLPSDLDFAYDLAVTDPQGWRWRYRGVVPQPSEFERTFFNDVAAAFVVQDDSGRPAGLAFVYGLNLRDGFAGLALQLADEKVLQGHGIGVAATCAEYAFERWPIRKLMLEVPQYNLPQFQSTVGRYLKVEGRLREHIYFNRRYWDVIQLALYPAHLDRWKSYLSSSPSDCSLAEVLSSSGVDIDSVSDSAQLADLGIDSLGIVEVLTQVELAVGHELDPELLKGITSLGELRSWYEERMATKWKPE